MQIDDLRRLVRDKNYVITVQILLEILHNLIDDGYLIKINDGYPNGNTFYRVTFKGRFFESAGGYAKDFERKNQAKNHAEQVEAAMQVNNKWLKIGTLVAGFATSCLVLIEIMKIVLNNQHYPKVIEIATFFFVFFAGITTGIITLLIILTVSNRKKIE